MYLIRSMGFSSYVVDTNAGNVDYVPNGVEGNTIYLDTTNGTIDYVVIPPIYGQVTLSSNISGEYWNTISLTWDNISANWN